MGSLTYSNIGRTLSYRYDGTGNISRVVDSQNGAAEQTDYLYDGLNQLIRVNDSAAGKTTTYTYDNGGNILTKRRYSYTTGSLDGRGYVVVQYTYGNENWKDLLTAYNGNAITYDAIGNPLTYYNGTTFTWDAGRQLSTATKADGTELSFKYNDSGIRTSKTVGGVTTEYFLDGTGVIAEKTGNNILWFYYDGDGSREAVEYNGAVYYYLYNAQGDVLGLFDNNLNVVVNYTYDSWGNLLSVTGSMANTLGQANPFRYRGYYYDTETGLYYLNSRYYDPETGRFINGDTITDGGAGLLGTNLFTYAANNPVNISDSSGHWIIKSAVKWFAKNVVKPVVKSVQKKLGKVNRTYSRGTNISGSPNIFSFNLQCGISVDTKGNVAVQVSYAGGVTTGSSGGSITSYRTVTNAPNIKKLEGPSYQCGGSVGIPVSNIPIAAGGDFNIIPDKELNRTYFGTTTNVGIGTPGAEVHIEWGETATWKQTQFNVFDIAQGVYVKIMEW